MVTHCETGLRMLDHCRNHVFASDPTQGEDPVTFDTFLLLTALSTLLQAERHVAEVLASFAHGTVALEFPRGLTLSDLDE
jgi:hypothetical protein